MSVSRRHFFLGSLALPALAARKPAPERPNILLIMVDQLPAWMLGSYGNKEVRTPNLDRFTQAGTRFLNHYACTPLPEPGRATLLTGRTPMQMGPSGTVSSGDVTMEKVLSGLGYTCHTSGQQASSDVTADAQKFLDQQSGATPFFLNVNFTDLRPPYEGISQKYLDLYAGERFENYSVEPAAANAKAGKEMLADRVTNLRKVAAGISALDDNVASLLTRIYQKQLTDKTLIIFTSTCGALLGRRGLWGAADASDPANMYNEVAKVPMVWHWPGHVPAQAVQVELVSSYDLTPTICDVLSTDLPNRNLCGRSYLLLATGKRLPKKQTWRTTVLGHCQNADMAAVARYKLVLRNDGKGPNELYDLRTDEGEHTNQADNEQFISVKSTLSAELAKWKSQYSG